ncbi:hypothetical protein MRS44_002101 [Fusarium solani]|uniref:uncharacterized protein n=1 Tax=Fusarium solani TaxID=169388 RepID=UPI0032C4323B|nr:hypothetical protein MRS44_002101 [Fusarium solani]
MATARIRTSDEPPSAAWNYQGANYVGFFDEPWGEDFQDQECQECTTADRTPADYQILEFELLPLWPECDEDDPDWLPDSQPHSHDAPLEYDSGLEAEDSDNGQSTSSYDESCCDDNDGDGQCGSYDGNRRLPEKRVLLPRGSISKIPPEHIASPTCRSLRGINGHVLSLAQMKNCRNVRFLVPKPSNWTTDVSEKLLEESSLFYLSGELNGSNFGVDGHFQPWRSFYPPRHGLHELRTNWEFIGEGCDKQESDVLRPLAVHSYCLDIYAKSSYHRLGRVDLDGLWYWSQLQNARLLALPTEVIHHILSFLDFPDIDTMAKTCQRLYDHAQPIFKACVFRDMFWLWEICEGSEYPTSLDRPATWDPLCPPGLLPPTLPFGLESKEAEDRLWTGIVASRVAHLSSLCRSVDTT